jgi:hypothetical protein
MLKILNKWLEFIKTKIIVLTRIEPKPNKANEMSISQRGPRVLTIDGFITNIKSPISPR